MNNNQISPDEVSQVDKAWEQYQRAQDRVLAVEADLVNILHYLQKNYPDVYQDVQCNRVECKLIQS